MTDLYLLDLDRTIFNTRRFFGDVKQAIQTTYGFNQAEFDATYAGFINTTVNSYDPHAHYGHLTGLSPEYLDQFIEAALAGRDYTFADAASWHATRGPEAKYLIITTGLPRYQALKIKHTGPFARLPSLVVPSNKGRLIRTQLAGGGGESGLKILTEPHDHIYLIDDSAETFTALGPTDKITGIRIARAGERYSGIPTPPHIRHITNFGELS